MEKDGVLRYETSYTPNYTITDYTGRYTYRDLVERFNPPVNSSVVISVATALHTKPPHQSNWKLPGNTPELFSTYLKKAISHLKAHPEMPQVLMCYNVSEWSEGGPGLVPTVGDGFGYLRAIYDNNV